MGVTKKRGHYAKFIPEVRAMIGKRAAEYGIVTSVRHFIKEFPNLKENTVGDWRDTVQTRIEQESKSGMPQ